MEKNQNKALWVFPNFKETVDTIPQKYRGRAWEMLIEYGFNGEICLEKENKYVKIVVKSLMPLMRLRGVGGSKNGVSNNPTGKKKANVGANVSASIGANVGATPYKQEQEQEKEQEQEQEKEQDSFNPTTQWMKKDIDNLFNSFYNKYPIKKSRNKALTSFKKALKKVSFKKLMAGLEKYLKEIEIKKTEKQYIKHPATWLNQECWQDEYEDKNTDKNKLLELLNEGEN